MKTIEQLSVPKQVDSDFPFGAIINETDTTDGTPVIREIYNDLLVNNYKLLEEVGATPNNVEDNETNGYQILEALKKLPNTLNDIERVLSLSTTVWSIPLNIDFLPNKYFFIARASEDYVAGTSYTFKGTTATSYTFTSSGFKALDELLVIIDQSNVRAYSLSQQLSTEAFAVLGTPIAFNDTNKMWYEEDGKLMSDVPSVNDLEGTIRVDVSDGTILLHSVFVMNGYVLCFCMKPSTNDYFFRQFPIGNLTASSAVSVVGVSFANSFDYSPYVYAESGIIYVTNGINSSTEDYSFAKFNYTPLTGLLTLVSQFELDITFVKTSNAVIKSGLLYTMISGVLESWDLTSGNKAILGNYSSVVGQLIRFNNQVYFCANEVCKKWF